MQFPQFPLYDNVLRKYGNVTEDITIEQKEAISERVKKMTENDHQIIYTIIKIHSIDVSPSTISALPYMGKMLKTGLKFDLDHFPPALQHILYAFLFKINPDN